MLHERIRKLRLAKGMTLQQLGDVFGISKVSVSNWESGTNQPDPKKPNELAKLLGTERGEHRAWLAHPRRMLRHKAMVQCARVCFGLVGIYDPDELARIRSAKDISEGKTAIRSAAPHRSSTQPSSQAALKSAIRGLGRPQQI